MKIALILVTSELASRQAHWLTHLCALAILGLITAMIYVTLRSLLTKPEKTVMAPHHIQRAPSILRWIALTALLLSNVAGLIELYLGIFQAGLAGEIDITTSHILLMQFLPYLLIGLIVTISALFGVGLIFLRHRQ